MTPPPRSRAVAETSLHKQLKSLYAGEGAQTEVVVGGYRIDAIADDLLIEVQHGSLAAIRDKIGVLLREHRVLVVKPIVHSKKLVKLSRKGGRIVERRRSPKRGQLTSIFEELVFFTGVFPHDNLTLEVAMVDVEEWRYPGHGRRRRKRERDHQVADLRLLELRESSRFEKASDLLGLLPDGLPQPFHTGQLAEAMDISRWSAQQVAYCLRKTGAASTVGKQGNAWLYAIPKLQAAGGVADPLSRRISSQRKGERI
jgi:hypothetical protein